MSVNKVILVGNVGADPEVRYIDSGVATCRLRIATSETFKNKEGQKVTQTEWHSVVLWRGLAEIAEKYVRKGAQIYVEGKLKTRTWTDKDGNNRTTTEIIADVLQLLGKRTDSQDPSAGKPEYQNSNREANTNPVNSTPIEDEGLVDTADDLPF